MRWNNLVALFHFFMLPFAVYFILKDSMSWTFIAICVLFISVLFDFAEKVLAKKQVVESFLHPFADKLVVNVLLLVLALTGELLWLVFGVFLLRDVVMGWIRMMASRDGVDVKGEFNARTFIGFQFALVFSILIGKFVSYTSRNVMNEVLGLIIIFFTLLALTFAVVSIAQCLSHYMRGVNHRRKLGKKVRKENLVILANKKSGGYRDVYRRHLLKLFSRRRNAKIVYLSKRKDFFKGLKLDGNQIIVAGGDGTFESALNHAPFHRKNLGFFPLGAGNAFYSHFYKGKRFEYLRSRFQFRQVPMDVMEVQWEGGKRQTLFLSIGTEAEMIRLVRKKSHHFNDYFMAAIDILANLKLSYNITVKTEKKKLRWPNCMGITLGKIPYFGYGMRSLLGRLDPDDGNILGMAYVNTHSPLWNKLVRIWSLVLVQLQLAKSPLVPFKGKNFTVKSDKPFPLQAGGEFLGYSKWMKVKVIRKQKVLMI